MATKTAGQIVRESRLLPASKQQAYIKTQSARQAGVTGASENLLSAQARTAIIRPYVAPIKKYSSGGRNIYVTPATLATTNPSAAYNLSMTDAISRNKPIPTLPGEGAVYTAPALGKITNVTHSFSDDEIIVKVTYLNTGTTVTEIRAYLYTSSGERVDKEPDTYWANVPASTSRTITLNSKWKYFDVGDLGGSYRVSIVAEGGIVIDEYSVSLSTGTAFQPKDRIQGQIINPDTSPANPTFTNAGIIPASQFTSITPPYSSPTTGINLASVLIVGGALYLLSK